MVCPPPKPPSTETSLRIKSVQSRHLTLKARLCKILELLYDLSQPRLTASEIKWFGELQSLYLTYIQQYTPQMEFIKSVSRSRDTVFEGEVLGMKQVREIKMSLKSESKELKEVGERVARLGKKYEVVEGNLLS